MARTKVFVLAAFVLATNVQAQTQYGNPISFEKPPRAVFETKPQQIPTPTPTPMEFGDPSVPLSRTQQATPTQTGTQILDRSLQFEPVRQPEGARPRSDRFFGTTRETGRAAAGVRQASTQSTIGFPQVTVEILGPQTINSFDPVDFQVVAKNVGDGIAEDCVLHVTPPRALEIVSTLPSTTSPQDSKWSLGNLTPGQTKTVTLRMRPVSEEEMVQFDARVTCSTSTALRIPVSIPRLKLSLNAPPEAFVGETVPFVLTVHNPSAAVANNVLVHSLLSDGLDHAAGREIEYEVGTLGPGESRSVKLDVLAHAMGRQSNAIELTVGPRVMDRLVGELNVHQPQISLEKTGPRKRYVGLPVTYSLVVQNPGTVPVRGVQVTDQVPEGLALVSASDNGRLTPDGRAVNWLLDEVPAGQSRRVTVTVVPKAPGTYVAQAVATAQGMEAKAASQTLVEGVTALAVEVSDVDDPIQTGSGTTYEIHVVNQGTQAASNLIVTATLPRGMRPLKVSGPAQYEIRGNEIMFRPVPRLAAKADTAYFIQVQADQSGDLRFRVKLECDQLETPVNTEESTRAFGDQ